MTPSPAPLPLAGIRILALEQYGAGPYGSMHLADLGTEVIKIEPDSLLEQCLRQAQHNPIMLDGQRPRGPVCSELGHDNAGLLGPR